MWLIINVLTVKLAPILIFWLEPTLRYLHYVECMLCIIYINLSLLRVNCIIFLFFFKIRNYLKFMNFETHHRTSEYIGKYRGGMYQRADIDVLEAIGYPDTYGRNVSEREFMYSRGKGYTKKRIDERGVMYRRKILNFLE